MNDMRMVMSKSVVARAILSIALLQFLFASSLGAQNVQLAARLLAADSKQPIEYMPVRLLDARGFEFTTQSDPKGHFSFDKLSIGASYTLKIAGSMLFDSLSIAIPQLLTSVDLGDIDLEPVSQELEEVTIASTQSRVDRQIYFPSATQVKRSSSATELVAALGSGVLSLRPESNTLASTRGGAIKLRINGAPATTQDFHRIDPKSIKRIDIHDMPSLKYGDVEVVVDLIMNERADGGEVYISGRSSILMPWGDLGAGMQYNYKRSQFALSLSHTHHEYERSYTNSTEQYLLASGSMVHRDLQGKAAPMKEYYPGVALKYNYSIPEKFLLAASFGFDFWKEAPNNVLGIAMERRDLTEPFSYQYEEKRTYKETKPTLDLYLHSQLSPKDVLALNLVGGYFEPQSTYTLTECNDEEILTDIQSAMKGSKYSLLSDLYYEGSFAPGSLTIGMKYSYGNLNNDYRVGDAQQTKVELLSHSGNVYTQWQGSIKKLRYSAGISYTINKQIQKGFETSTTQFLTPSVGLSYSPVKNLQFRYHSSMSLINPSLGESSGLEMPINKYLLWRGNTKLLPYTRYINRLSASYRQDKLRLSFDAYDSYTAKGIMDAYFQEGDRIVNQQINGDVLHHLNLQAGLNVDLLQDKLEISTYGTYQWMHSLAADYNHIRRNWIASLELYYTMGAFSVWTNIRTRRHNLVGERLYKGGSMMSAGVNYKRKALRLGLGYMTNGDAPNSELEIFNRYYQSKRRTYNPDFNSKTLYLSLSYRFNFGKQYQSLDRLRYNSDTDSGIKRL